MVTRYEITGKCKVCGKPVKRDQGRARQNRTCSKPCLSKLASMNSKRRYRSRAAGLTSYESEDYLDLVAMAEIARGDRKKELISEARKMLRRLVPNTYLG